MQVRIHAYWRATLFGLKKTYSGGFAYKKAGVMLMSINDARTTEGTEMTALSTIRVVKAALT
jgi:DNA polymerase V